MLDSLKKLVSIWSVAFFLYICSHLNEYAYETTLSSFLVFSTLLYNE